MTASDPRPPLRRAVDPRPSAPSVRAELRDDRTVGGRDLTRWRTPVGRALAALAHRVSERLGAYTALVVILVVGGGIAALLTVGFGEVYEAVVEADGVAALDRPLLGWAVESRTPVLDTVVTAFTTVGGPVVMPVLASAVAVLLAARRRSWTPFLLMLLGGGGSLLMTIAGKRLFGRVRPPYADAVPPFESSPSFPSGHSLNAFVLAGLVAYLLILRQRRVLLRAAIVAAAAAFAVAMGLSRVYLGHHWFTDVLAAWLVGAAWLAFVITVHRLYLTVQERRQDRVPVQPPPNTLGA